MPVVLCCAMHPLLPLQMLTMQLSSIHRLSLVEMPTCCTKKLGSQLQAHAHKQGHRAGAAASALFGGLAVGVQPYHRHTTQGEFKALQTSRQWLSARLSRALTCTPDGTQQHSLHSRQSTHASRVSSADPQQQAGRACVRYILLVPAAGPRRARWSSCNAAPAVNTHMPHTQRAAPTRSSTP